MIRSLLVELARIARTDRVQLPHERAASITWKASKQPYYTVRFQVGRDRVHEAYRAYGYFRWPEDQLDQGALDLPKQM